MLISGLSIVDLKTINKNKLELLGVVISFVKRSYLLKTIH